MADIFGVRVTPDLDTINSFVICNDFAGQIDPAVVFNGENHIVVWTDEFFDRQFTGIQAVAISPQGVMVDTSYFIGPGEYYPAVAYDSVQSLIVWCDGDYGIRGRFVNELAQPQGNLLEITTITGTMTVPKLAFGQENYLLVYADFCSLGTDLDIYGYLVTPQGQVIQEKIFIATGSASQSYPDIVFDGANFLVVWRQDQYSIYGQIIDQEGCLVGSSFKINDNTNHNREEPTVGAGSDNYLVVWGEWHDDFDLFANIDYEISIQEKEDNIPGSYIGWLIKSPGVLDDLGKITIFDVSGRITMPDAVESGVYFIRTEDKKIHKIIIFR